MTGAETAPPLTLSGPQLPFLTLSGPQLPSLRVSLLKSRTIYHTIADMFFQMLAKNNKCCGQVILTLNMTYLAPIKHAGNI